MDLRFLGGLRENKRGLPELAGALAETGACRLRPGKGLTGGIMQK